MLRWLPAALLPAALLLAGCPHAGGDYATGGREPGLADRGETNGRMFDFIADRPDGDDWQIRIRDDSMWVSYSDGDDVEDLGTKALTSKEARRVWDLIDNCDLGGRKKGKQNADTGVYQLKLREPSDESAAHDEISVFVSRETEDEDVVALTEYLQKLISRYHPKYRKERAAF